MNSRQESSVTRFAVVSHCGTAMLMLVLMIAFCTGVFAQQAPASTLLPSASKLAVPVPTNVATAAVARPVAKSEEEEETATPGKPGSEGIKIHGHWVLQVKNADGTPGERREFNNSLISGSGFTALSGSQLLALMFSGNGVPGDPAIAFIQGTLTGDPTTACINGTGSTICYGYTTSKSPLFNVNNTLNRWNPINLYYSQQGLFITVSFSPNVNWVLSGNYSVPNGLTTINYVQTYLPVCTAINEPFINAPYSSVFPSVFGTYSDRTAIQSPNSCDNNAAMVLLGGLTSAAVTNGSGVATPLAVTQGQIVTVTVTITFS
jgi:hypothetical protein